MSTTSTILHIAPTPFFADRGCHIRIEGIVRCLEELDYQNLVCTYHHGRDVAGVTTRRISPIRAYTQTAAGPSRYKLWADWRLLWLSMGAFRSVRPTAIHAHLHEGLLIGLIIKVAFFWRKTPLIADMQGSLVGELDAHGAFQKLPFLRWPTRMMEKILMLCADHILCSSKHSLEKLSSEFSIPAEKISLVQDGADAPVALSEDQRQQLMDQYSLPGDKNIVVYSGALLDSKGLQELKQLIVDSDDLAEAIHFLIIGYPEENLQPFLQEQQLQNLVTLTGQIPFDELPNLLGLAEIAIDPKKSDAGEGSGKMLNYLACGLPVLAFDTSNNREFLPDGAILASDSAQLAVQFSELATNEPMRQAISQGNLTRFQQLYSWQTTRQQLAAVYSSRVETSEQ